MRIWVDGDACPQDVRDIVIRAAERLAIEVTFVANKELRLPRSKFIKFSRVGHGADVADSFIVQESAFGDLVISSDIPLAALLVPKGVVVVTMYGDILNTATINERLSIRNFMTDLRSGGVTTGGPRPFGIKERQAFAATFDRELTKLVRR